MWASGAGQTPATFGFQHDGAGRITLTQVNRSDLEWMPTLAEAASYGVPTNLNQMTSANGVGLVWDYKGNLDQHGTTDYQWTFGNRLWRVVKPASTTEYAYDSTDRRTMVIEDGVMTRTLWSGADEVGEYDTAGTLQRRFIPDGSGAMDARLAMVSSTGDVSWFHTNHQGSVIAMSNASGAATAFANYSEYGKFGTDANGSPLSSPPGGSPFGYTGRQWDARAGLYQYRARYYDPVLGVFLSMDPIGTKDDPNLYMYVGLDPVNKTDPTGREIRTSKTVEQRENGTTRTVVSITFTAALRNDGGSLNGGSLSRMATNIENQIEADFQGSFTDAEGNETVYRTTADISVGRATGDRHQISVVRHGSAILQGGMGIAPGFENGRDLYISDNTVGDGQRFRRTGSHEFGHSAGLRHPRFLDPTNTLDPPRENLMTQGKWSDSHQVTEEQLGSIYERFQQ